MTSARKRVMFITPPYHCGVVESVGRWPNLGFFYMAGELRSLGYEVFIYDAMSRFDDYANIESELSAFRPDVVCSTAYTATINDAIKVLGLAKSVDPHVITIVGGVHPTFCWEEVLRDNGDKVDFCIIGEGEHTLGPLLEAAIGGQPVDDVQGIAFVSDGKPVRTAARPFIEDLDSLTPAWDLVDWKEYPLYFIDDSRVAVVSSSRGCIYECSFCSQHKFWHGTYRERDAVKFVDELQYLYEKHNVNAFLLADEYPTRSRRRWEHILSELVKRDLGIHLLLETCVQDIVRDEDIMQQYVAAGVLFIYLGVEAATQERLETFKKDIKFETSQRAIRLVKDAGMMCESSLILGVPDETVASIEETFELAKLYDPDYMHFLLIAPWPYADIYDDLKPFIEEWDYSKYNLVEPILKPHTMSREQLFKAIIDCYKRYYMPKLTEWKQMEPGLKRTCLLKSIKAMVENSFLKDHMSGLGEIPEEVSRIILQPSNI